MTVWGVRAGSNGENEGVALDQSIVVIGWSTLGDIAGGSSRDALVELYRKTWPDSSENRLINQASQVWRFKDTISEGDLVVLPLVCENHGVKLRKRKPTLNDFNEELKNGGVIDQPTWRRNQHPGDLRNKCAHQGPE